MFSNKGLGKYLLVYSHKVVPVSHQKEKYKLWEVLSAKCETEQHCKVYNVYGSFVVKEQLQAQVCKLKTRCCGTECWPSTKFLLPFSHSYRLSIGHIAQRTVQLWRAREVFTDRRWTEGVCHCWVSALRRWSEYSYYFPPCLSWTPTAMVPQPGPCCWCQFSTEQPSNTTKKEGILNGHAERAALPD